MCLHQRYGLFPVACFSSDLISGIVKHVKVWQDSFDEIQAYLKASASIEQQTKYIAEKYAYFE
jgi:hypothetical protein